MTTRRHLLLTGVAAWLAAGLPWAARAQAQKPPVAPLASEQAGQPTQGDDQDAIEAGKQWLALIDAGNAGKAWDTSSAHLKSIVTRQKWIAGMRDARKPFGKLASRNATKFARAHSMPGAPDGDYALIEYEATFANGKRATEQLTWMLEDSGAWRVSGYYIK
jgi:hypothetical protein